MFEEQENGMGSFPGEVDIMIDLLLCVRQPVFLKQGLQLERVIYEQQTTVGTGKWGHAMGRKLISEPTKLSQSLSLNRMLRS